MINWPRRYSNSSQSRNPRGRRKIDLFGYCVFVNYDKSVSSTIKLHLELFYWVSLLCCVLVLLPHLDGFIALAAQQSAATAVECQGKDAILGSDRTRLRLTQDILVIVAGLPVPELQSAIVSSADQHVVLVDLNSEFFTASASMMEL